MEYILVILFLGLNSCNYSRMKEETRSGSSDALRFLGVLDYKIVNSSVIGPKCVSCHSNAGGNQGGVNLETYENIRQYIARIGFRALEKRDMPPKVPLTADEMTVLKSWIENGAPENFVNATGDGDDGIDMGPTDWQKISTKIFTPKCYDCHSSPNPHANLDLTSYNEVKMNAAKIFDRTIIQQNMPIEPYPALSPKERKALLNWFNMGMPN